MEFQEFDIIQLTNSDLTNLLKLQREIVDEIQNESFFSDRSCEFEELLTHHVVIGCKDRSNILVSYCALKIPLDVNIAFGYGIIGHIESIGVRPKFRGYGLQKRMLTEAESYANKKKVLFLMATVSPENRISRKNFESLQYKQLAEIICYDGHNRIVIGKKISDNSHFSDSHMKSDSQFLSNT